MKPERSRLDKILADRGLCETRSQAQGLILAGQVLVNGTQADKPGSLFPDSCVIAIKERPRFVSRGGLKMEMALTDFDITITDRICVDVGASTGGFTDCLLQYGAAHVYSADVGYGQLDWKLRQDERVTVLERTHAKTLPDIEMDPLPSLAVADVSFISLKKVMPHMAKVLSGDSGFAKEMIVLIKPQFEYRDYCKIPGFNGVVMDPAVRIEIITGLVQDLEKLLPGWQQVNQVESPITGPKGNHEFLSHWRAS